MNLEELKQKAEAATPEACEPIIRFGDGPLMWYPAHRPECIHTPVNLACDCDKEQREAAMYEYAEAYNPKVGLALVKVVEAADALIELVDETGVRVHGEASSLRIMAKYQAFRKAHDELEALE